MSTRREPGADEGLVSRRAVLKSIAAAELCAVMPSAVLGQANAWDVQRRSAVLAYLESLARPDGGYAWDDLCEPHLGPTFAAIAIYRVFDQVPPRKTELAEFVRTHHPAQLQKKLEQEHHEFEFQQIQSLVWLGEDASSFREQVSRWTRPAQYLKQYEQHSFPIFRFELAAFTCRKLLGMPLDDLAPHFVEYLDSRRRGNGSFNNTPSADGSEGHVLNTLWGLQALAILGREQENKKATVAWLRSCQIPSGGFTYQPNPELGGVDDAAYTWGAVKALQMLGAEPADREACGRYLASLWNSDAGAGDRPGWASHPVATRYALETLDSLREPLPAPRKPSRSRVEPLPADLKVFTAQIEAHGSGSPADAVALAGALRIHLWGAKNAKAGWIARAQAIADGQKVPVRFFVADEEYGTWVKVPGLGAYSHTCDMIAPVGSDPGPSLANKGVVSWPEFRARRLDPLQKAGGRLVWQFGENEELVRIYLDDSIARGGYAAISTFHFGNPDFTNTEPFLNRYRGHLPFVALQDAHGPEPWWFSDQTSGFRTLFLAREPTWEGWLEALGHNRVVAVRRDAASHFKLWMHGGAREVIDFVRQNETDWRWWDNPEIRRPLVSLLAIRPGDEFETPRPESGVMLRVRVARENTGQGVPTKPIAELVKLTVDDRDVSTTPVSKRRPNGALDDEFQQYHWPDPAPGEHTATAIVREIASGRESRRTIRF